MNAFFELLQFREKQKHSEVVTKNHEIVNISNEYLNKNSELNRELIILKKTNKNKNNRKMYLVRKEVEHEEKNTKE